MKWTGLALSASKVAATALLASVLLMAMVLSARRGSWSTVHYAGLGTPERLTIAAAVLVAARRYRFGTLMEATLWSIVIVGAAVASQCGNALLIGASCAYALVAVIGGVRASRQHCIVGPVYLRQAIGP